MAVEPLVNPTLEPDEPDSARHNEARHREPVLENRAQPVRRIPLLAAINTPARIVTAYLGLIAVAEIMVTYVRPELGAIVHILTLVILIIHASLADSPPVAELLTALVIAPLVRVLSLSLPLFVFDLRYWYIIVSIPLFISAFFIVRNLRWSLRKIGFNFNYPLIQIAVIIFGFIFGAVEYLILRPEPLVPIPSVESFIVTSLILIIGTGLMEELVFRGVLQQAAEKALGVKGSILFATLVFTTLHIGWNSAIDLMFVFTAGTMWGIVFYRTRSIIGITISHGITNILLFIVLPLLL